MHKEDWRRSANAFEKAMDVERMTNPHGEQLRQITLNYQSAAEKLREQEEEEGEIDTETETDTDTQADTETEDETETETEGETERKKSKPKQGVEVTFKGEKKQADKRTDTEADTDTDANTDSNSYTARAPSPAPTQPQTSKPTQTQTPSKRTTTRTPTRTPSVPSNKHTRQPGEPERFSIEDTFGFDPSLRSDEDTEREQREIMERERFVKSLGESHAREVQQGVFCAVVCA